MKVSLFLGLRLLYLEISFAIECKTNKQTNKNHAFKKLNLQTNNNYYYYKSLNPYPNLGSLIFSLWLCFSLWHLSETCALNKAEGESHR